MDRPIHTEEIVKVRRYTERTYGTSAHINKNKALSIAGKSPVSYGAESMHEKYEYVDSINTASKGLFPIRYSTGLFIKRKLIQGKIVRINTIQFNHHPRYRILPDYVHVLSETVFWRYLIAPIKTSVIRSIESIK